MASAPSRASPCARSRPLLFLDRRKALGVRIAHDRHDQAALGRHGNPDVVVLVIDDVAPVDRGVQYRKLLQRLDRRLDEERHEAELHAVLFPRSAPCSVCAVPGCVALRSTSLKVVSRRLRQTAPRSNGCAMRARRRVMGTRCSARAPAAAGGPRSRNPGRRCRRGGGSDRGRAAGAAARPHCRARQAFCRGSPPRRTWSGVRRVPKPGSWPDRGGSPRPAAAPRG